MYLTSCDVTVHKKYPHVVHYNRGRFKIKLRMKERKRDKEGERNAVF